MRIFEPLEELEVYDGERLIGIYVPGLTYNCMDDNRTLSATLDHWLEQGKAKIIEQRKGGAQYGEISGQGEVQ